MAGEATSPKTKGKRKTVTRHLPSGEGASSSGSGDAGSQGSSEKGDTGADQKGSSSTKRIKSGGLQIEKMEKLSDGIFSRGKFLQSSIALYVQRAFEGLSSEAFRPLQDSICLWLILLRVLFPLLRLQELLKKFNRRPPKVRTQICVAITALAVHVPREDWGGGGIVNLLGDKMKSQQEFIPGFLELLIVLPQVLTMALLETLIWSCLIYWELTCMARFLQNPWVA